METTTERITHNDGLNGAIPSHVKANGTGDAPAKRKLEWNAATLDSVLLILLILTMCSQMNLRAIGHDTLAEGKGFATKQLFIAVSDVMLALTFLWFIIRTTMLRAWSRIWWPSLPCWALIVALIIATVHAPALSRMVQESAEKGQHFGPKAILHAIKTKEGKEAVAHVIQFVLYFLVGILLFVNLICDRRGAEVIIRRRLALHVFPVAVLLATLLGAWQMLLLKHDPPHAFFGSPNVYSGFLAFALPLLVAHMIHEWRGVPQVFFTVALSILLAIATISSLWAVLALLIGIAVGGLLLRQPGRTGILLGASALVACVVWVGAVKLAQDDAAFRSLATESVQDPEHLKHPINLVRADFLRVAGDSSKSPGVENENESDPKAFNVKKQFIEWYAALGWAMPRQRAFATGVGPGNYQLNIGTYYGSLPNVKKMPPDSNNLYLVQGVSIGLLGLGALLWVLSYFARQAWMARKRYANDWLGAGVLASLASFAFVNLFHALIVRGVGIVLAFVLSLAIIAAQGDLHQRDKPGL
ncbi:MAG: hypothetical protein JO316_09365 [Abitibacteriaceae bacterium]|nr:hypothetical protein [Abditibacteriaceae bacterium]